MKKIKADFESQIFIIVGKVITFLETEIEQYVVILKTKEFIKCSNVINSGTN